MQPSEAVPSIAASLRRRGGKNYCKSQRLAALVGLALEKEFICCNTASRFDACNDCDWQFVTGNL
jgi:hypothetical protein